MVSLHAQVPNWSRVGRLKRSKFPSLAGGGHSFGGGAGAGVMLVLAGSPPSSLLLQSDFRSFPVLLALACQQVPFVTAVAVSGFYGFRVEDKPT